MQLNEVTKIVKDLSAREALPTLDQLVEKYGLLDAMSIQAGIVVSAIQARINLTESVKEDESETGFAYYEEDQSHFPW